MRKTFAHSYPEDFEFDPKTGRALWESVDELKEMAEKLGLEVQQSNNTEVKNKVYVGLILRKTEYDHKAASPVSLSGVEITDMHKDVCGRLSVLLEKR